jgi:hypothetical protein
MKRNFLEKKSNEIEGEIQAEVREPIERSSINQIMKLERSIVTLREVEFRRKENMEEEALLLEEEEDLEKVKIDVIFVER